MTHFHSHAHPHETPVATRGNVLHWGKHYDVFAHLLTLGGERAMREQAIALANVRAGSQVLEVGCGTGTLALLAKKQAGPTGRVYGIDPAPEMLATARQKAAAAQLEVEFRSGAAEKLPFPDATFDVVLSSLMMHHLPHDLKQPALAEMRRVLKPGGQVFIVDFKRPANWLEHLLSPMVWHGALKVGIQDLTSLVQAAGFSEVQAGTLNLRYLGYLRAWVKD